MKTGDYVRYVGPGHIAMTDPDLPLEWVSQVEHWVNNFRHKDHNCSTWLFRPVWPEQKPGGSFSMPFDRKYHYGIACDYEVVTYETKQHFVEVEQGLKAAKRLMGDA